MIGYKCPLSLQFNVSGARQYDLLYCSTFGFLMSNNISIAVQFLRSLSDLPFAHKAWRKEAFDILFSKRFFTSDHSGRDSENSNRTMCQLTVIYNIYARLTFFVLSCVTVLKSWMYVMDRLFTRDASALDELVVGVSSEVEHGGTRNI